MLPVADKGSDILVVPVTEHLRQTRRNDTVPAGAHPVADNASRDAAYYIEARQVNLGHDPAQGHRLALEPAAHAGPCLVMVMEDRGIGDVADPHPRLGQPLGQLHVFQAGQILVERMLFPCGPVEGRVGIVAEEAFLGDLRRLGEVFGEDAPLAVIAVIVADLPTIGIGHRPRDDGLAELLQPVPPDRHAMAADEDQYVAGAEGAGAVQRPSEGEFGLGDVGDPASVPLGDREGPVGGARVDHDRFHVDALRFLKADHGQQIVEMDILVQGTDYYACPQFRASFPNSITDTLAIPY